MQSFYHSNQEGIAMKTIGKYFCWGIFVAIIGMIFATLFATFFNGMDKAGALAVGVGLYLCMVVITCTGIIVSKLEAHFSSK